MEWTDANQFAAANDGWHLKGPSRNNKQRLRTLGPRFTSHPEMHGHIVRAALGGSPLHLKALAIIYGHNKRAFLAIMEAVPANKTGALVKTIITMARMSGLVQGEP